MIQQHKIKTGYKWLLLNNNYQTLGLIKKQLPLKKFNKTAA